MEICNDGHEEIVYDDSGNRNSRSKCPLCSALEEINELQKITYELQEELNEQLAKN